MDTNAKSLPLPQYIAHALGGIDGLTYTNSLEAFLYSYQVKKYKFFEIDINLASDDEFILIHDFKDTYVKLFATEAVDLPSSQAFLNKKIREKYTGLSLKQICELLKKYDDISIVSDCKLEDNLMFLNYIDKDYPDLKDRFYIQAYYLYELPEIQRLGFKNIIFANYRQVYSKKEILDANAEYEFKAIAFNKNLANSSLVKELINANLQILVHTVNDVEEIEKLRELGICSFFTDFL